MKFSATFLTALAILPALIEAYNPFPVTGHGLDISARTGTGHKMIKRRVVKRGCTVRSASSTIAAGEAFAQQPSTSTSTEETFTSTSAVATPTGGSDSSLPAAVAGPFTGDGTFFAPGLNACGGTNDSSDKIVAVAAELFDQFPGNTGNPNTNPICGRKLLISYKGETVEATVRDRCPGCTFGSLDMTESLFNELAASSVGRLSDSIGTGSISWVWA